jgi:hypothetical protein
MQSFGRTYLSRLSPVDPDICANDIVCGRERLDERPVLDMAGPGHVEVLEYPDLAKVCDRGTECLVL